MRVVNRAAANCGVDRLHLRRRRRGDTDAPTVTPDQTFMVDAAGDGLREVALGRLAASQGDGQAVRDLGRTLVADRGVANDPLLTIALSQGVTPPRDLTPNAQATCDKLSALHGKSFDQTFLSAMTDDRKADIQRVQHEVDIGSDPAVKDWARGTLPTLKSHLAQMQCLTPAGK